MQKLNFVLIGVLAILLTSCSVAGIQKHNPNFKTTREIRKLKGSYHVADVSSKDAAMEERLKSSSLSCRLTTFSMPANMTVKDFIQTALTDELDAAEKLAKSGTPITLRVNSMESSSSSFSKGSWTLDFSYLVGKKEFNVKTVTEFESAYMAETACRNTANGLSTALTENFISFAEKFK